MAIKRKRLGLAEILLGGLVAFSSPNFIRAQEQNSKPEITDTFGYKSHRKGYEGKVFKYNLWSDGTISQADKPGVKFSQRWFYDIDGDGKFGNVERKAIKSGKLVYMHPDFNEIANEEIRNAVKKAYEDLILERQEKEKLSQELELKREKYEQEIEELKGRYEEKLEYFEEKEEIIKEEKAREPLIPTLAQFPNHVEKVLEDYMNHEGNIYAGLDESTKHILLSMGDPKKITDDDLLGVAEGLGTVKNNLERVLTDSNVTIHGEAMVKKIEETGNKLGELMKMYEKAKKMTENGLEGYEKATKDLEGSSQEIIEKIEAKKIATQKRAEDLGALIAEMDYLVKYGKKIKNAKEFEILKQDKEEFKLGKFLYKTKEKPKENPSEVAKEIANNLGDINKDAKNDLNKELYETFNKEFFYPQVLELIDLYENILKDYTDPKEIARISKEHQLGDELSKQIFEEKANLESAIKTLETLIGRKAEREERGRYPGYRGTRTKPLDSNSRERGKGVEGEIEQTPFEISGRLTANIGKEPGWRYWIGAGVGNLEVFGYFEKPSDKVVLEEEIPLSNGVVGRGKIEKTNQSTLGGAFQYSPFKKKSNKKSNIYPLIGLGLGVNIWTTKTSEELVKNGNILESNTISIPQLKPFETFYVGIGGRYNRVSLDLVGGYEFAKNLEKGDFYAGLGINYSFGNKRKK